MAGETALSAYSATSGYQGWYILGDNNGWVAANTPNTCNLGGDTGLVLGTGFLYFNQLELFTDYHQVPPSDNFIGWSLSQDGTTALKVKAHTGQAILYQFTLTVKVDLTTAELWRKFFQVHQARTGYIQLYLVHQLATTTFEQFSYNATLYKYTPVIIIAPSGLEQIQAEHYEFQTLKITMIQAIREG